MKFIIEHRKIIVSKNSNELQLPKSASNAWCSTLVIRVEDIVFLKIIIGVIG